ncbi:hypothetical protein THAOC_16553 [Thalassiosira oceanica]|uniref:Uncharacterized protein n=1 Tax=Thalassiosira oceanica TaxID=159749 RepID=K0SX71_THAOC|nr:hypothetical protein THAOC_16553 [Thalassiosira oceanica]|eukprot:EJK62822.1 hypothetical protein THAOC_16553 [Thalassiosira oceanica]
MFLPCHLRILKSLYIAGDESERDSNGTIAAVDDAGDQAVSNDTWELVEEFLGRRDDYKPYRERAIYWKNISNEAESRLEELDNESTTDHVPPSRPQSRCGSTLPPRTPLFTSSMSLTPLSSNRNDSGHCSAREQPPAWNFINHMLNKRSNIVDDDCKKFRSERFLTELCSESERRVISLQKAYQNLVRGSNSSDAIDVSLDDSKGPKRARSKSSLLVNHFSVADAETPQSEEDPSISEMNEKDSSIILHHKLWLWSLLLSSVKEIVNDVK